MKKILQSLLWLVLPILLQAQVVTTNPAFPTLGTSDIEIIFDAAQGNQGLKGYTGTVYAHTGVITDKSANDSEWKSAPTWGDNSSKYRLTKVSTDKYKLTIPSIATYYTNIPAGEVVKKLAFVFRSIDNTKEGKDVGNADILVAIYPDGLNVSFTSPTSNQSVSAGSNIEFSFSSSITADLSLLVNGNSVKTQSAATSLSHTYTFTAVGDYTVIAKAQSGSETAEDTLYVNVPSSVVTEARPAGIVDGINYIDNTTVTLSLFAPLKNKVFVIGDFNDWRQMNTYQMKKDGDYWWITLTGLTPGELYGFQYLVDDTLRISDAYTELVLDPWNDSYISSTVFPDLKPYPKDKTSELVSTFQTAKSAYSWEVTNFTMPAHENMVIYELLLRDFTDEKTLEAAIAKLDYLQTLGVTAVELMPIQEFDGNLSWGYNPNHYFAPDKAYGTPDMYKKFIDECHKRGMAVIVDVVFNHATGINPFARLYWDSANSQTAANNPWFNVTAPHPYSVFHDFNHEYAGTRTFFKRVLKYWLEEYKIDGYRLDLTKGFTQNSSNESTAANYDQSRIDILTDYYNATKSVKSDVMFILEHFANNDEETVLANAGMYLWRNANNAFSQTAMGFSSDSDFSGLNSTPRRWVGYAESHDEERNFYKAKAFGDGTIKTDSVTRINRVPLNVAFTTLVPGPKMIWQFGEMGYDISLDYNERTGEKPSGLGAALNYLNVPVRKAAYEASSKIISLRKDYPAAFLNGTSQLNISTADWDAGRRIGLTHTDLNMVVLGNFKASAAITANPNFPKTGKWYELLTGEELDVTNTSMTINIPAGTVRIYTDRKSSGIDNPVSDNTNNVYPTVTSGKVYVTSGTANSVYVYNMQGALVKASSDVSEIDITDSPSGVYILKVSSNNGNSVHRIVKK